MAEEKPPVSETDTPTTVEPAEAGGAESPAGSDAALTDSAAPTSETDSPSAAPTPGAAAPSDPPDEAGAPVEPVAGDDSSAPEGAQPDRAALDELLKDGNFEDPAALAGAGGADAAEYNLPDLQKVMREAQVSSIDLLRDVDLNVKIELGRSRMLVEDVLKLGEGSVVEIDKLAGDPVDVFVNDRLVARGEVLVLNDNFCVRINEIVSGAREEGM